MLTLKLTRGVSLDSPLYLRRRFLSIFNSVGVNVRVTFKSFRVGRYFSLKSATPAGLRAKVVYKFHSSCDRNLSYIGKTKRHLAIRVAEHLSERSGSAIFDHLRECQTCRHSVCLDNFTVLSNAQSDYVLRIKEALLIKEKKPLLNKQLTQQGSFFFLGIFWAYYYSPLYWLYVIIVISFSTLNLY